jgi:hypothetical protein
MHSHFLLHQEVLAENCLQTKLLMNTILMAQYYFTIQLTVYETTGNITLRKIKHDADIFNLYFLFATGITR